VEGENIAMARNVLITGAARGIGAETARVFAAGGWQVGVHFHRSEQRAAALVKELRENGCAAGMLQADLSDPLQASDLVRQAEEMMGALDALVCNAGAGRFGLLTDCTDAQWRETMAVNLDGVFFPLRQAARSMVCRKQGAIVTVSSMWGVTGASCEAAYSAAKAGVIGLTRAAAKELGPSGIRVNCVAPGVIDTEMNSHLSPADLQTLKEEMPMGRIGAPEEVAQVIYFLCTERASYLTGQVLQPNGGILI